MQLFGAAEKRGVVSRPFRRQPRRGGKSECCEARFHWAIMKVASKVIERN
jgi:hypothetical protein